MIKISEAEAKKFGLIEEKPAQTGKKAEETIMNENNKTKIIKGEPNEIQAGKNKRTLLTIAFVVLGFIAFRNMYKENQELKAAETAGLKTEIEQLRNELEEQKAVTVDTSVLDQNEIVQLTAEQETIDTSELEPARTSDPEYEVVKGIYFDYLYVECENGQYYFLDEDGEWFDDNGKVVFDDGEVLTAVVSEDSIIAIIRDIES